jgi:hypothetical protein
MSSVIGSPSGSVHGGVIVPSVSSAIVSDCAGQTGASLIAVIETETVAAALVAVPSLAVYVKLSAPFAFAFGA